MGRRPCCGGEQGTVKKGAWTAEEDEKLVAFITKNKGHGRWRTVPTLAGLERCGKSCRLRWTNYLRPNIKRGNFSSHEEGVILQLHALVGNKWSTISSYLAGRTDNEVKNYWNTYLKKRLAKMGIDPATHLPFNFFPFQLLHLLGNPSAIGSVSDWHEALLSQFLQVNATVARHLVQRELARLETESATFHTFYTKNYYASALQNPAQSQAPASGMSAFLPENRAQQQPLVNIFPEPNVCFATQIHDSQTFDKLFSTTFSPASCEGDQTSPSWSNSFSSRASLSQYGLPADLANIQPSVNLNSNQIIDLGTSTVAFGDSVSQNDSFWWKLLHVLDHDSPEASKLDNVS